MKVLFTFNGLPHYSNLVLSRLNNIKGLDIGVVIPESGVNTIGKGVYQSEEGINFSVFRLPEYKTFYGKFFYKNFITFIKSFKPDIIVFVWPYNLALLFFPWITVYLKSNGIKIIYKDIPFLLPKFSDGLTCKNFTLLDEDLKKFELTFSKRIYFMGFTVMRRIYYKFFDAHVNYVEDAFDILPTYGVNKDNIFITYNSPDTDVLFESKRKAGLLDPLLPFSKYRLIHVGRLVKWKKVDLLINAISKLKSKYAQIELIVIGTGPEEENLKCLAEQLKVTDCIKFIGPIYDPVILGRYLLDSTIYVIAGMGGLSINEAMAFEKPIICSICDGTEKKLVRNNYNGRFFENDNLDDLVKSIDSLLVSYENIIKMGQNSLSIIKNEVNITTVLTGYIKAFNFVTHNRNNLTL